MKFYQKTAILWCSYEYFNHLTPPETGYPSLVSPIDYMSSKMNH